MRGESIRTGYGDLGQVGISFVWPPVIQVRRSRRPESRKYSPAAHFFRHDGIPVVRRVIKHVHYFRVVCYPIGNCEWWTSLSSSRGALKAEQLLQNQFTQSPSLHYIGG